MSVSLQHVVGIALILFLGCFTGLTFTNYYFRDRSTVDTLEFAPCPSSRFSNPTPTNIASLKNNFQETELSSTTTNLQTSKKRLAITTFMDQRTRSYCFHLRLMKSFKDFSPLPHLNITFFIVENNISLQLTGPQREKLRDLGGVFRQISTPPPIENYEELKTKYPIEAIYINKLDSLRIEDLHQQPSQFDAILYIDNDIIITNSIDPILQDFTRIGIAPDEVEPTAIANLIAPLLDPEYTVKTINSLSYFNSGIVLFPPELLEPFLTKFFQLWGENVVYSLPFNLGLIEQMMFGVAIDQLHLLPVVWSWDFNCPIASELKYRDVYCSANASVMHHHGQGAFYNANEDIFPYLPEKPVAAILKNYNDKREFESC